MFDIMRVSAFHLQRYTKDQQSYHIQEAKQLCLYPAMENQLCLCVKVVRT